jgi:hypothetical protein
MAVTREPQGPRHTEPGLQADWRRFSRLRVLGRAMQALLRFDVPCIFGMATVTVAYLFAKVPS